MKVELLSDQLDALDALAQITHAFAHLPAVDISVSPITPDELTISLHDNLDGFEQWRTALGISPADVDFQQRPHGTHMTLKARARFAEAAVELVGFAPAVESIGGGS